MKNVFGRLISRLDIAEKTISELVDMSLESSKTKEQYVKERKGNHIKCSIKSTKGRKRVKDKIGTKIRVTNGKFNKYDRYISTYQ